MLHSYKRNRGFTLIELFVTISIAVAILTVVITNQATYSNALALSRVAEEISLDITQAQVYGTGVREVTPGSSDFSISYGITVSIRSGGVDGSAFDYLAFADKDGDEVYDGNWTCPIGGASECLKKTTLINSNYIESICIVKTGEPDQCNASRVDVSFTRPNIKANLKFFNNGGQPLAPANIKGAKINLMSPNGLEKSVIVYTTGQISVQ